MRIKVINSVIQQTHTYECKFVLMLASLMKLHVDPWSPSAIYISFINYQHRRNGPHTQRTQRSGDHNNKLLARDGTWQTLLHLVAIDTLSRLAGQLSLPATALHTAPLCPSFIAYSHSWIILYSPVHCFCLRSFFIIFTFIQIEYWHGLNR